MNSNTVSARPWPADLFPPAARRLLRERGEIADSTVVAATVRENNGRLFSVGLWFGLLASLDGVIMTVGAFGGIEAWDAVLLGVAGIAFFGGLLTRRRRAFQLATETGAMLAPVTAFCFAAVALTGTFNPSYFNLVFAPLLLAVFSGRRRATYLCAMAMIVADMIGYLMFKPALPVIGSLTNTSLMVTDAIEIIVVAVLLNALADALAGSIAHVDPAARSAPEDGLNADGGLRLHKLSARELEVVLWLGGGLTNREIGERMFLSVRTVESHIASALRKTDCDNRTMLAVGIARRVARERIARGEARGSSDQLICSTYGDGLLPPR